MIQVPDQTDPDAAPIVGVISRVGACGLGFPTRTDFDFAVSALAAVANHKMITESVTPFVDVANPTKSSVYGDALMTPAQQIFTRPFGPMETSAP